MASLWSACAFHAAPPATLSEARPIRAASVAAVAAFLDSAAPAEMAATGTPGVAIAVVLGDSIVYAKGFGVASVETRAPVTPDMLFRVASTTKMLTATAVLMSASRGQLGLDRLLESLLPELPPQLALLTMRDLLRHRAGLRDGSSYYGPHDDSAYYGPHDDSALGEFVRSWADTVLFTAPNDIYSYSNLGYIAAGALLERASGMSYADAMKEHLFRPLGMQRSTLRPTEAMTYPIAQGHELGTDGRLAVVRPYSDDARYWPAGSVFTSANEFARFVVALLNNGRISGTQVLPPSVVQEMLTRQTDVPGSAPSERAGYALGLVIRDLRGVLAYQHGGVRIGFGSVVRLLPERRAGIIILANRTNGLLLRTLATGDNGARRYLHIAGHALLRH
jgi:CubicO group peptidase (beta-lactamase class C family)